MVLIVYCSKLMEQDCVSSLNNTSIVTSDLTLVFSSCFLCFPIHFPLYYIILFLLIHCLYSLQILVLIYIFLYGRFPRSFVFTMNHFLRYLRSRILKLSDKKIRYKHHITFLDAYLKARKIPKGFNINFHNNIGPDRNFYDRILFNSAKKLMLHTITFYRSQIEIFSQQIDEYIDIVKEKFVFYHQSILDQIKSKSVNLSKILAIRRSRKFRRDGLVFPPSTPPSTRYAIQALYDPISH